MSSGMGASNDIWTLNVTWNNENNDISYANMIDVVRVVVLEVDEKRRRISLSMKQAKQN